MRRLHAEYRYLAIVLVSAVLVFAAAASAQDPSIKTSMDVVYTSFKELQPYLLSSNRFEAKENEQRIHALIDTLQKGFHTVEKIDTSYTNQPGFNSTLVLISGALKDAEARFTEGRKGWAMWRLKTITNHCITCHTTYGVEMGFHDPNPNVSELNDLERGEFFLATRQFEQAEDAFLKAARNTGEGGASDDSQRFEALSKWLIIYTRINADPKNAITQLQQVVRTGGFSRYELEQIAEWIASLRRWVNEGKSSASSLRKAENLLRQSLGMNDPLYSKTGTVELLRATGLLHTTLENSADKPVERRKALYLLGLSYAKLPTFFINELPEFFLEQCIRDYPESPEAIKSYKLYKDVVTLGYTGSSGIHLPTDVKLKLRELHDIAYGKITVSAH